MSKRRRIEVTIFRRRTTVTRRERFEKGSPELPPRDERAAPPVGTDPAQLVEAALDHSQATQHDAGQSDLYGDGQNPELVP